MHNRQSASIGLTLDWESVEGDLSSNIIFDKTYWLEIHIIPNVVASGEPPLFGWKTSLDHWNDDAVFETDVADIWAELWDPRPEIQPPVSLDMAFVITPEPATLAVLLIGAALSLARRR